MLQHLLFRHNCAHPCYFENNNNLSTAYSKPIVGTLCCPTEPNWFNKTTQINTQVKDYVFKTKHGWKECILRGERSASCSGHMWLESKGMSPTAAFRPNSSLTLENLFLKWLNNITNHLRDISTDMQQKFQVFLWVWLCSMLNGGYFFLR